MAYPSHSLQETDYIQGDPLLKYRSSSSYDDIVSPKKPIVGWKYPKSKMHPIDLTYWTSQLSLAYLKRAQNTDISLQLGKIIEHKANFIIKYKQLM